jgi:hypothetical protein
MLCFNSCVVCPVIDHPPESGDLEKRMKGMRYTLFVIDLLLASVLLTLPCAAQQYRLRPQPEVIPRSLFGVVIHSVDSETAWPPGEFGGVRLWDANVTWWNIEYHGKGQLDFARMDKVVALAASHGSELLMNLGTPPPWASARPTELPDFRKGGAAEPKNIQDWRDYVRALATRYKGRIHCWEIWNEPNDPVFYTGTISKLVELSMEAYKILKQVDPSNIVVSPSATYGLKGAPWLDDYLRAGGGAYADVIGYHFYVMPSPPEEMLPIIEKVKSVLAKNGMQNKPLWNTEAGWLIQNRAMSVKSNGKNVPLLEEQAPGFVARAYILNWAAGASRFYWYDWDSAVMGLADDGGKTPKPAGVAFLTTEKWLVGARLSYCDSDARDTWVCPISRDGGYRGYLVWNVHGPAGLEIPADWDAQKESELDGHQHDVKGLRKATVDMRPVLFENKSPN